jgi:GNAT superfamily N-acetyltransferase
MTTQYAKLNELQSVCVDAEPSVTFRFAERGDCPLILTFIRSLAEYENLLDRVAATESLLENWLFEKRAGEVMFAVEDGREVGFAMFFPNFSTFLGQAGLYIEDLFVLPESRGHGIGTAILRELAAIAVKRGYGRMDWQCLNWNTPSIEFYCSLGAEPQSDWTTYRMSGDKLNELAHDG